MNYLILKLYTSNLRLDFFSLPATLFITNLDHNLTNMFLIPLRPLAWRLFDTGQLFSETYHVRHCFFDLFELPNLLVNKWLDLIGFYCLIHILHLLTATG